MAKKNAKGLGDTIEQITEATGIKKVVELFSSVTGIDCGCDERKEKLNALVPYKRTVNCLNQDDYNTLTEFVSPKKGSLTIQEQFIVSDIYFRVFNERLESSNCSSCWRDIIGDLRKVYNQYEIND